MAAAITSFTNTKEYDYLLQQPKEELVQRDMIHDLLSRQSNTQNASSEVLWLEEELEEARGTSHRLIEGDSVEWEVIA
jgi:hypothetical protein